MFLIPLEQSPNQQFTAVLDGYRYAVRLTTCAGITCADIERDDVVVISGVRCVGGFVIPYPYLEAGNFWFETDDGEYPDYTLFGDTQFLYYLTQAEVDSVRAG